jgi:carbohydrate diacid regulator
MHVIHHNINVMDAKGVIIASGETKRIGTTHEGAILALRRNDRVDIDDVQTKQLQGVKVGTNLLIEFQEKVLGVIGITGDPQEVSKYGELTKMTAEMMIEQTYFIRKIEWTNRLKEEFIFSLIYERYSSTQIKEYVHRLGIEEEHPWIASLIEISVENVSTDEQMKRINILFNEVTKYFPYALVAIIDYSRIVLLNNVKLHGSIHRKLSQLKETSQMPLHVAIGKEYVHLKNIHKSYRAAQEIMRIGKILYPTEHVYDVEKLKLQALFHDIHVEWKREELYASYDVLIKNDKNGELQQTLKAFIEENGELGQIATKLFIHRNTLRYRLNRIYELTKKDPKNIQDLFWLYSAMLHHILEVKK